MKAITSEQFTEAINTNKAKLGILSIVAKCNADIVTKLDTINNGLSLNIVGPLTINGNLTLGPGSTTNIKGAVSNKK